MRRLRLILLSFCMGIILVFASTGIVGATDVWVSHWNDENVDVYVMDNTLDYGINSNGRWFSVSTKMVQNGHLKRIVNWHFVKSGSEVWRYYTNTMSGDHTTAVHPYNGVFVYGMKYLGWPYYVRDMWYY